MACTQWDTGSSRVGHPQPRLCRKKQELQPECAATWESYEAAVLEAGLPIDPHSGVLAVPTIYERQHPVIDAKTGRMTAAIYAITTLRWKHLRASAALSKHLSGYRC